jgi:2-polyprenyl-6-methoxyphenol hydroxylase-like FAD-dependent oxidoreductase
MTHDSAATESRPRDTSVLIAGAGPTGLVLALWLTRLSVPVRIVDKTAEPGTTSRAVAVTARTLELYQYLRMADGLVEGGVQVAAANLWTRGARAARLPFRRMGEGLSPFPYMLIFPQDAHERLLIEQLESMGVRVERRTELVRFKEENGGVRATLRRADGAEESCAASFLAGCDGAHSVVRETLGTGFPGGTYAEIFYVADVDAGGPAVNGELHVDLEEADFLAVFPLKGSGRARLIGSVLPDAAREPDNLTFADVSARAIENMKVAIRSVNWFSTYHVHHRVAAKFRVGRAFLLGDAAHVHSPVGGQGMNTGIGDAVNLAWKLAAVVKGEAAETLLDSYEPERIAFARRLVATTDRAFTMATSRGAATRVIRTRIVPPLLSLLFRLARWRRFMFHTVSQIGVHYRHSPLSEGSAGKLRGGDRLPWVRTGADSQGAEDNFASLTAVTWQVHIYGDPRPDLLEACGRLGLPLTVFGWLPEMKRAGLTRNALYLIRPDGYLGLCHEKGDTARLRGYVAKHGIRVSR